MSSIASTNPPVPGGLYEIPDDLAAGCPEVPLFRVSKDQKAAKKDWQINVKKNLSLAAMDKQIDAICTLYGVNKVYCEHPTEPGQAHVPMPWTGDLTYIPPEDEELVLTKHLL